MRHQMKKYVFLVLLGMVLAACEKGDPVEKSVRRLVESMQEEGNFGKVEKAMVSDQSIRPDWRVMQNRKQVSWDWMRMEVQKRVGPQPKLAKMDVQEMFAGTADRPTKLNRANVLLTFEGAPDTLWLLCGLNTGYILNMGFWQNGRLVTDAAD